MVFFIADEALFSSCVGWVYCSLLLRCYCTVICRNGSSESSTVTYLPAVPEVADSSLLSMG